ncbi:MAG TPA: chloride channel protein, partial [Dokdonella sp.]
TQAPLTSAVISLELTANHTLIIPIMAACLIARALSTLACPTPVYRAFANRLVAMQAAAAREPPPRSPARRARHVPAPRGP